MKTAKWCPWLNDSPYASYPGIGALEPISGILLNSKWATPYTPVAMPSLVKCKLPGAFPELVLGQISPGFDLESTRILMLPQHSRIALSASVAFGSRPRMVVELGAFLARRGMF